MKAFFYRTVFSFLCLILSSVSIYAQQGHLMASGQSRPCLLTSEQIPFQILDSRERETLLFMREEEKLARDVYLALFSQYGSQVFSNIANSEQQHMDTLKAFLDAWRLDDPVFPEPGKFSNLDLQDLYNELVSKGSVSALEAYKVGALIEEIDIKDLQNAIEETDSLELQNAYQNLQAASYNHLRAFSRQIINLEGSYSAQFLSTEEVEVILSSPSVPASQGNALHYDGQELLSNANACFIADIENSQGVLQNGSYIGQTTAISIVQTVRPLTEDINQPADWLIVAYYFDNVGNTYSFTRNGESWQLWNGDINNLPFAEQTTNLGVENSLSIFEGQLTGLSGQLQVYSGYRLNDGSIVFNRFPVVLNMEE